MSTSAERISYQTWLKEILQKLNGKDITVLAQLYELLKNPNTTPTQVGILVVELGLVNYQGQDLSHSQPVDTERNYVKLSAFYVLLSYLVGIEKKPVYMNPRNMGVPPHTHPLMPQTERPGLYGQFDHLYRRDWRDYPGYQVGDFPGFGPHVGTPRPDPAPGYAGATPVDIGQIHQAVSTLQESVDQLLKGQDNMAGRIYRLEEARKQSVVEKVTAWAASDTPTPPPTPGVNEMNAAAEGSTLRRQNTSQEDQLPGLI